MMAATMPSIRSVLLSLAALHWRRGPGQRRRWGPSRGSEDDQLVLDMLLLLDDESAADRHDGGDDAVRSVPLSLAGLRLPAGSWATVMAGLPAIRPGGVTPR
jgi:hypothetical protein